MGAEEPFIGLLRHPLDIALIEWIFINGSNSKDLSYSFDKLVRCRIYEGQISEDIFRDENVFSFLTSVFLKVMLLTVNYLMP